MDFSIIKVIIDKSSILLVLLISSFAIQFSLIYARQHWVKTFTATITFLLLPIITYSITTVISGNLALSLGMVGALSIVRFRNPVKSSLELTVYFLLISLGVCASVKVMWSIFLGSASAIIIFASEILNNISKKYLKKNLYQLSFHEGNVMSVLEVTSKNEILEISESQFLVFKSINDGMHNYKLADSNNAQLLKIYSNLKNNNTVISVFFHTS
jgi:hypothetical protein